MKIRRERKFSAGIHIDMTPMVDVMMLLVIFFMMSTTFLIAYPGFVVNLPRASAANDQPPDNIMVVVGRDGQIAVADRPVTLGELAAVAAAQAQRQPTVYIKADKEVAHGRVVEVMDTVRKAGVAKISVAVEPKGR